MTSSMVLVPMDEATIARLLLHRNPGESLTSVVSRIVSPPAEEIPSLNEPDTVQSVQLTRSGKHSCEILETTVRANTLGELFGHVIDVFDGLAPELVQKFSQVGSSRRSFVSRDRQGIHLGRPDLPTFHTKSGWWVSRNVSHSQTVSQLRKLCKATGLEWKKDIRFP